MYIEINTVQVVG